MNGDNVLNRKQVAEMLQVSDSWLYRKCRAGIIPHYRIGGTIRFSEQAVNAWLQSHHVKGCQKMSSLRL